MSTAIDQNPKNRLIIVSILFVWLVYFGVQVALLLWYAYSWKNILQDSLLNASLVAFGTFTIGNMLNYYQPKRGSYFNIIIWVLSLAAISIALGKYLLPLLVEDVDYLSFVHLSLPLRFCINALVIGAMSIIFMFWNMAQSQKENEKRKMDAERLAKEAELYNLRQQLQPHFLFNSLNSIIALIGRKPDQARNMTFQLSDFLRGTLRKDDQQLIPLEDEIEHLKLYLEIEKVRFGHRLATTLNYPEDCADCKLPAMILQPLVENAIKHGLYGTTEGVNIDLEMKKEDNLLVVQITNPFDKENTPPRKGTGFGLRGVQRRLFLLFGRTDLLHTSSSTHIFTSTIKIPQL
ncbi:sensor histidine kinase [Olivibacter sitiensis]|uniref:sensor histidine kinase n=1 Tax=Olivibacter sitiensis TaxID=376470 RepID=UPI00040C1A40|nr:histidine kinase [Olivibacter sitiensis]